MAFILSANLTTTMPSGGCKMKYSKNFDSKLITSKPENEIQGSEGIVFHNGNIVLGMQTPKRWYNLGGKKAAVIKTLGGKLEPEDQNDSKNALTREFKEEIRCETELKLNFEEIPIFTKK